MNNLENIFINDRYGNPIYFLIARPLYIYSFTSLYIRDVQGLSTSGGIFQKIFYGGLGSIRIFDVAMQKTDFFALI